MRDSDKMQSSSDSQTRLDNGSGRDKNDFSYASLVRERYNDSRMVAARCAKSNSSWGFGDSIRPYHDALIDEIKKQSDRPTSSLFLTHGHDTCGCWKRMTIGEEGQALVML